ncbi:hypothetical protein QFC22_006585 [Naganishia vaughanmartiniae]|uniref:Uncharacterized protein n=1 Tax=Naganishia vaughanmartiniae TaxID=1424756 RepID=A0ACC2WJ51_9TREE|nr:hypothetical protein QFC22_006585 [Naganishia vaughanmartiniae]
MEKDRLQRKLSNRSRQLASSAIPNEKRLNGERISGGIMDFGGLRHGGHSADLSSDGNRLYIADMQFRTRSDTQVLADRKVRTSPAGDVLFASTRGLEPSQKGYIISVALDPMTEYIAGTPTVADPRSGMEECLPLHRWQTPTSGGWANALSVCPTTGRHNGSEVYMSLTDSGQRWV